MENCVRERSFRGRFLATLVAAFTVAACADDETPETAPIGVDADAGRPDAAGPMPGLGMMTETRDASFSAPDAAQPRDAAQPPAVSDAGAPKPDAGSDAGDTGSAASDSGAARDAG